MEIYADIKFTSPEQDSDFWAQLVEGLCDHKRGAWLESQFDRFGERASSLITESWMSAIKVMPELRH